MSILGTRLFCPLIHQLSKCSNTACIVNCQRIGCIVGRIQQKTAHTIFHTHFFPLCNGQCHIIGRKRIQGFSLANQRICQLTVLQCQQSCHNLRNTGRIHLSIRILGIQNRSRLRIHQNSRIRTDRRTRRPVFGLNIGRSGCLFPDFHLCGLFRFLFCFSRFCFS